ncbi:ParA family protein [Cellulomonas sp. FA1]|uniref:ParA family protein n=1 Tax=Cellulomonas sp. FA1 TaxID=1346710 RepID=UPI000626BA13|nr:ParA family protein [Cellulomonas sp. FA1]
MKTVAFFNNKGGVGKTTLTCNVAAHFAHSLGQKVLLVDCDPQCNTTQLLLAEEVCDDLYWSGNTAQLPTLVDVTRPLEEGGAEIDESVTPMRSSSNRFGVDLLPGHPRMAIVEDLLSRAWAEASGGDLGGIRKTNWTTDLRERHANEYDVLFFDLGPSLGSLNRSVLLGCDYFVTPMGADIFSIVGVRNIRDWFRQWLDSYETALQLCEKRHPGALERYYADARSTIGEGFVGYTVQQYITKSKQGRRRPTLAFERILNSVPGEVRDSLGEFYAPGITDDSAKLGDVPNMYSLIPMAQSANAPIAKLGTGDGLVGAQYRQQQNYAAVVGSVARSLAQNLGIQVRS